MGKLTRWGLLILITFLYCESYEQEFEPESNILAVIKVGYGDMWWAEREVIVDRTYSIEETLYTYDPEFIADYIEEGVHGADVIVRWDNDTVFFDEDTTWGDSGIYYSRFKYPIPVDSIPVIDDTTLYTLEVRLPWGDTVVGSSYMPSPIKLSWPGWYDTISISKELADPHMVCWNSCRNVSMYVLYCEESGMYIIPPLYFPSFTTDTCYPLFAERAVWPWKFGTCYELVVVGITPEYAAYSDPRNFGRGNLSSGYGLFTGITTDVRNVYIVE